MDHVRAPGDRVPGAFELAKIGGVDLDPGMHPFGGGPTVGDPDLVATISEQPPYDGPADRPSAAGHEHTAHGCAPTAGALSRGVVSRVDALGLAEHCRG